MANVAFVKALNGLAYITDINGNKHELKVGDTINLGDTLMGGGSQSNLILAFNNGKELELSGNETLKIDQSVINQDSFDPNDTNLADISNLQQAILQGQDLTNLEETAAGGDTQAGGGAGGTSLGSAEFLSSGSISNVEAKTSNLDTNTQNSNVNASVNSLGAGEVVDVVADTPVVTTPVEKYKFALIGMSDAVQADYGSINAFKIRGNLKPNSEFKIDKYFFEGNIDHEYFYENAKIAESNGEISNTDIENMRAKYIERETQNRHNMSDDDKTQLTEWVGKLPIYELKAMHDMREYSDELASKTYTTDDNGNFEVVFNHMRSLGGDAMMRPVIEGTTENGESIRVVVGNYFRNNLEFANDTESIIVNTTAKKMTITDIPNEENATMLKIEGIAEKAAKVSIVDSDGNVVGLERKADYDDGSFRFYVKYPENGEKLYVKSVDIAGNEGTQEITNINLHPYPSEVAYNQMYDVSRYADSNINLMTLNSNYSIGNTFELIDTSENADNIAEETNVRGLKTRAYAKVIAEDIDGNKLGEGVADSWGSVDIRLNRAIDSHEIIKFTAIDEFGNKESMSLIAPDNLQLALETRLTPHINDETTYIKNIQTEKIDTTGNGEFDVVKVSGNVEKNSIWISINETSANIDADGNFEVLVAKENMRNWGDDADKAIIRIHSHDLGVGEIHTRLDITNDPVKTNTDLKVNIGTGGDADTFVYDSNADLIFGGSRNSEGTLVSAGISDRSYPVHDTLVVKESIDFSKVENLDSKVQGFEIIKLDGGDITLENFTRQVVYDISDHGSLRIVGDAGDSLELSSDFVKSDNTRFLDPGFDRYSIKSANSVNDGFIEVSKDVRVTIKEDIGTSETSNALTNELDNNLIV